MAQRKIPVAESCSGPSAQAQWRTLKAPREFFAAGLESGMTHDRRRGRRHKSYPHEAGPVFHKGEFIS